MRRQKWMQGCGLAAVALLMTISVAQTQVLSDAVASDVLKQGRNLRTQIEQRQADMLQYSEKFRNIRVAQIPWRDIQEGIRKGGETIGEIGKEVGKLKCEEKSKTGDGYSKRGHARDACERLIRSMEDEGHKVSRCETEQGGKYWYPVVYYQPAGCVF